LALLLALQEEKAVNAVKMEPTDQEITYVPQFPHRWVMLNMNQSPPGYRLNVTFGLAHGWLMGAPSRAK